MSYDEVLVKNTEPSQLRVEIFLRSWPLKYLCLYRQLRAITVSVLSSCFVTNQLDCNSGSRWRQRRQFRVKPSYFMIATSCDWMVFVNQTTRLYFSD